MWITKNVLLNWYSSMKKKLRRIQMIFDVKNWLWRLNFGTFWHLHITTILKIQSFSMGMLIFRQKSFQFFTPRLKTWQPVIPYSALWSKTFCWTKALQFLWSDFYWLSQSLIFLCCNFYFLFFLQKNFFCFLSWCNLIEHGIIWIPESFVERSAFHLFYYSV